MHPKFLHIWLLVLKITFLSSLYLPTASSPSRPQSTTHLSFSLLFHNFEVLEFQPSLSMHCWYLHITPNTNTFKQRLWVLHRWIWLDDLLLKTVRDENEKEVQDGSLSIRMEGEQTVGGMECEFEGRYLQCPYSTALHGSYFPEGIIVHKFRMDKLLMQMNR